MDSEVHLFVTMIIRKRKCIIKRARKHNEYQIFFYRINLNNVEKKFVVISAMKLWGLGCINTC